MGPPPRSRKAGLCCALPPAFLLKVLTIHPRVQVLLSVLAAGVSSHHLVRERENIQRERERESAGVEGRKGGWSVGCRIFTPWIPPILYAKEGGAGRKR